MGVAAIGYVVLRVLAAVGLIGLIYAKLAQRQRLGWVAVTMLAAGVAGMIFWGIFLDGLRKTLSDSISEGIAAQRNYAVELEFARMNHLPAPKPADDIQDKLKEGTDAERTARTYGWQRIVDQWYKDLRWTPGAFGSLPPSVSKPQPERDARERR